MPRLRLLAELIVRGLERILLRRGNGGVEKRGEGVRLAAIDETRDEKLILKSFGMAGAAQEREKSAHFGVGMNHDLIVALDGGNDQSAKGAAIAERGGIDGVEQLHAQERAFWQYAENVRCGSFHAGLQLETYNGARGNLQRGDPRRRLRIRGLALGGEYGEAENAYEQRDEMTQQKPLPAVKYREYSN